MKAFIYLSLLFSLILTPTSQLLATEEAAPPKADSVWGAMKYSGYYIKKGSITTGKGIKHGSIKTGQEIKKGSKATGRGIVKGSKATGRGFKKAGNEVKGFFVGKDKK